MIQYKWIYLVHMPLFCFLSGLFLENSRVCGRQFVRMLTVYLCLQTLAVLLGKGAVKLLTPWWHLWYLLSYSTWAGLGWLWLRFGKEKGKLVIFILAVLAGCLAGLHPGIGRAYSLSRTVVFFPYFWLGLLWDPEFPWERLRFASVLALGCVFLAVALWGDQISAVFLYQATPYGKQENGMVCRLLCYLLGILLGMVLLAFAPGMRFPFTRAGADTMPAYLLHAPLVLYIRELDVPWPVHLLIAGAILYGTYKLLQWHSTLYGIVPTEGRGSRCLPFRRLTKNTRSRSIGSC